MVYRQDHKLTELGERVRNKCHKTRIDGFQILYLFRDEPAKRKGKVLIGQAKMPNPLTQFLCEGAFGMTPDFLIEIAEAPYKDLTPAQREALLDHELAHLGAKDDKDTSVPIIRAHDVEEFREVLERRGAWSPGLKDFIQTAKQLKLFPKEAA